MEGRQFQHSAVETGEGLRRVPFINEGARQEDFSEEVLQGEMGVF